MVLFLPLIEQSSDYNVVYSFKSFVKIKFTIKGGAITTSIFIHVNVVQRANMNLFPSNKSLIPEYP